MTVFRLTAAEVRPFDGITENTVVMHVTHHKAEQRDPLTGEVMLREVVTITSAVAQIVVVDDFEGQHLHEIQRGAADERSYAPDDLLWVIRPVALAKCACGYPADEDQA